MDRLLHVDASPAGLGSVIWACRQTDERPLLHASATSKRLIRLLELEDEWGSLRFAEGPMPERVAQSAPLPPAAAEDIFFHTLGELADTDDQLVLEILDDVDMCRCTACAECTTRQALAADYGLYDIIDDTRADTA